MSMTHEEAARILDPDTTREALNPYADSPVERMRLLDEACRIAAEVLRNRKTGEALTLEQLREMDGQPVWLSVAGGVWGLVNAFDNCAVLSTGGDIKLRSLSGYAFSYPPAESWYELEKMVRELD